MLIPESIFAVMLVFLGVIQIVLAFYAARRAQRTLNQITSPLDRMAMTRKICRPVYGLLWLAFLSLMTAALSIVIPFYLSARFGL
jgi:hypothetical protein